MPSYSLEFAKEAMNALEKARFATVGSTNQTASALKLGKACFWAGEFASNSTQRAELAEEGIAVCRQILAVQPASAEGHYYLAMNLGQLARTKLLGALPLVRDMDRSLKHAAAASPALDYAGPDRCLGLLYRDAPGWPISVGSRSKAKRHLLNAFARAPDYPENILNLVQTWIEWRDKDSLRRDLNAGEAVLKKAATIFTGPEWVPHWDTWNRQWSTLKAKGDRILKNR